MKHCRGTVGPQLTISLLPTCRHTQGRAPGLHSQGCSHADGGLAVVRRMKGKGPGQGHLPGQPSSTHLHPTSFTPGTNAAPGSAQPVGSRRAVVSRPGWARLLSFLFNGPLPSTAPGPLPRTSRAHLPCVVTGGPAQPAWPGLTSLSPGLEVESSGRLLESAPPPLPPVFCWVSQEKGFHGGSVGNESAHHAGDLGSIPGSGRSPGEGHGNPLQFTCLENPRTEEPGGYSPWGHIETTFTGKNRVCGPSAW